MGDSYVKFKIEGTSLAPYGNSLLEFSKSDDSGKHTSLPFLDVFLSNTL